MKISEINGWDEAGPKKDNEQCICSLEEPYIDEQKNLVLCRICEKQVGPQTWDACLSSIESLDMGMDREELFKTLILVLLGIGDQYDKLPGLTKLTIYGYTDAIIANQSKILRIARGSNE